MTEGSDAWSYERRMLPRLRTAQEHAITAVRVRPGIEATLIDISSGGVAIDTSRRLIPGRFVHLQLVRPDAIVTVRGRVARTDVQWLTAGLIVYRCAVQFDHLLDLRHAVIQLSPPEPLTGA